MNLVPIDSFADPRVSDYSNLPDKRLKSGPEQPPDGSAPRSLFIAEGELVVRRLIDSRFRVKSILVTPAKVESLAGALARLDSDVPVFLAEPNLINEIAGFKFHHGVLACGVRRELPNIEEILNDATGVAVVEDITNTDNLGSIFRSISALGGERPAVILSPGCCDPLYRKCLRVSMGHVLEVPFTRLEPWPQALERLSGGFRLVALTPEAPDIASLPPSDLAPALLVGTEGPGLSERTRSFAPWKASIPMRTGVDSLNVAVAFAVAMHTLMPRP